MKEQKTLLETHQVLKDSLDVTVKIDWIQVLKVTVEDLIKKYNSCVERKSDHQNAFKEVLLYYLGDEDFEKYVVNKEKRNVMSKRLYTKDEVHEYVEFLIGCDREGLPLLDIEGYFNLNK